MTQHEEREVSSTTYGPSQHDSLAAAAQRELGTCECGLPNTPREMKWNTAVLVCDFKRIHYLETQPNESYLRHLLADAERRLTLTLETPRATEADVAAARVEVEELRSRLEVA